MCGIAGFLAPPTGGECAHRAAQAMAARLVHRGPDDGGVWTDPETGVGLAHRRLSILDLSAEGQQPMLSGDGRFVLVFNGEIYNFAALRAELAGRGHAFRGRSDTEVLLAAAVEWGVQGAVERCVGMFAFALWDRRARRLHLGRDRLGEKPLYYGQVGDALLFGSELKALAAHPAWTGEVDRHAVGLFVRYGYVPAPHSIYRDVRKLPAGHLLTLAPAAEAVPDPEPYWSLREVAERGMREPFLGSDREAADALEAVLGEAVAGQMVADVPLGAFLSGGVDSSAIVALMQARSDRPVRTFTIGFREEGYDEAEHARAVAAHLGTDHTELYVTPDEARTVIPLLPEMYDEPFADSSQIPTFLVARLARASVTVSLSGDAGDELFGGYNRHFWAPGMWRRMRRVPRWARRGAARSLALASPAAWDRAAALAHPVLPARLRQPRVGEKLEKVARVLDAASPEEMYQRLVSLVDDPAGLVPGFREDGGGMARGPSGIGDFASRMMYLDAVGYLADDILVKVDRAAMAVSLETRVPFLDHRVVELAWRLPLSLKVRDGTGKWILRQVLYRHVPRALIERPKAGFAVPVAAGLRGPLRDWGAALLDETRLREQGFFAPAAVGRLWRQHGEGRRDHGAALWTVLMFQAWLERSRGSAGLRGA